MAPCASLYSIKVLGEDGSGWWSDIFRAANSVLEYVTNTATADEAVIINMSLGSDCTYYGGCTETKYAGKLWRGLLEAGVTLIAAAGNGDEDTYERAREARRGEPTFIAARALTPRSSGAPAPRLLTNPRWR